MMASPKFDLAFRLVPPIVPPTVITFSSFVLSTSGNPPPLISSPSLPPATT